MKRPWLYTVLLSSRTLFRPRAALSGMEVESTLILATPPLKFSIKPFATESVELR